MVRFIVEPIDGTDFLERFTIKELAVKGRTSKERATEVGVLLAQDETYGPLIMGQGLWIAPAPRWHYPVGAVQPKPKRHDQVAIACAVTLDDGVAAHCNQSSIRACPNSGGNGTRSQLGLQSKPLGLLDVRGYFARLALSSTTWWQSAS